MVEYQYTKKLKRKPSDPPHKHGTIQRMWAGCKCDPCRLMGNAQQRDYRQKNPRKVRDQNLKQNFGLSIEDYEDLLVEQEGVCAACGQTETKRNQYGLVSLAVDHDHDSGRVRGILCMNCNRALGLLMDSPEKLEQLLQYRRKF